MDYYVSNLIRLLMQAWKDPERIRTASERDTGAFTSGFSTQKLYSAAESFRLGIIIVFETMNYLVAELSR